MSPTSYYNVKMIATPLPAEPQVVNFSAILFSTNEGKLQVTETYLPLPT
jgi:hypothetical protein